MLLPKTKYIRDKRHLKFISTLPCVVTGSNEVQASHIRSGMGGMGLKSGDNCVLPLNWEVHQRQHAMGSEAAFWAKYGGIEKAKELANALWLRTGQREECLKLITRFRRGFIHS